MNFLYIILGQTSYNYHKDSVWLVLSCLFFKEFNFFICGYSLYLMTNNYFKNLRSKVYEAKTQKKFERT